MGRSKWMNRKQPSPVGMLLEFLGSKQGAKCAAALREQHDYHKLRRAAGKPDWREEYIRLREERRRAS